MKQAQAVRIGIDVGGTHTKAVAIDNATQCIIGKASVKTTHDDKQGVAAGVVEAFKECLEKNNILASDIVFVAHSTTQATNALLEGDVAKVGIIGTAGPGFEGFLAKRQTAVKGIDLGTGRSIDVSSRFIPKKIMCEETIQAALGELKNAGAEVLVASSAFGVDDLTEETWISSIAGKKQMLSTMASEMSKLYGLSRRTKTAVFNASILPKMLETASSTESSIRDAGVKVPLMIMRGDGGVMDVVEMKKRPVLTMLSGPAASVMGALIYLRASNGIYFEVGGTSTNIGVIKNGRPTIGYSTLNGQQTYISSLDVKVLGVAGGSMVRADRHQLIDVGPRSAHIGGKDYAAFTLEEEIIDPKLVFFSPKDGDPEDYVAIELRNGRQITITNTCAANVLGLIDPIYFSHGNAASARKAMQPLADYLNLSVEETAKKILERSYQKIKPVILELAEKYHLEKDQMSLVGVGGGAASLICYCAEQLKLNYSIPENAEVISSIGVALSMVREVVERIVPNPCKEDIDHLKMEAMNKVIESGATEESVEVHIEIDPQKQKISAIATGSTEVQSADHTVSCSEQEALEIAAEDLSVSKEKVALLEKTPHFFVCGCSLSSNNHPVRIVDKKGLIRVQRKNAFIKKVSRQTCIDGLKSYWEELSNYQSDLIIRPDYYLCVGPRLMDFSTSDFDQLKMLVELEIDMAGNDQDILIVAANQLT